MITCQVQFENSEIVHFTELPEVQCSSDKYMKYL